MAATEFIKARVTVETKRGIAEAAAREMFSESAWLKRLLVREMQSAGAPMVTLAAPRRSHGIRRNSDRPGSACGPPDLGAAEAGGPLAAGRTL